MGRAVMEELQELDRELLMRRMAAELPEIRKLLGVSRVSLTSRIEMDPERYKNIEDKKENLNWSEYMSLLFLFWNNETGRNIIESRGLFPDILKRAMSVNRNVHATQMNLGYRE